MAKRVSIFVGLLLWAGATLWWGSICPVAGVRAADGADAAPAVQSSPSSAPDRADDQTSCALPHNRHEIVSALLSRRELENVRFQVPVDVLRDYMAARDRAGPPNVPVAAIAQDSQYRFTVGDGGATLNAKLTLRILDHSHAVNLPVLGNGLAWEKISVDGEAAKLPTVGDWLVLSLRHNGLCTVAAQATLGKNAAADNLDFAIIAAVGTKVLFDSGNTYQVQVSGQAPAACSLNTQGQGQGQDKPHIDQAQWTTTLRGGAEKGTHGEVALSPSQQIHLEYGPVQPVQVHPARYELRGNIACNIDAAAQQVTASLAVTIAGGPSDKITLIVPKDAQRVAVTGPDVKEARFDSGRATVYLRGQVLGQTPLNVSYELPLAKGGEVRLGVIGVQDGYWQGGTLVVTNSAGGSEVLPVSATGLKEIGLYEAPSSALASLPGPAAMAYSITSREFAASVEVVQLGEFALRQSLADLAHYELFMQDDGAILCSARYEVRNRSRQFLRVQLPKGSRLLLARVNEKSCPISEATDDQWLLPLERSRASIIGLVSFPVEVVYACRIAAPLPGKGTAQIPLPAIDLPIAYAWSEVYLPQEMTLTGLSGPMKRVEQFSNQTAKASLDYGWGELAEGYKESSRPVAPIPDIGRLPTGKGDVRRGDRPAAKPGFFSFLAPKTDSYRFLDPTSLIATPQSQSAPLIPILHIDSPSPAGGPETGHTWAASHGKGFKSLDVDPNAILARNAYRAGKDYYEKDDYDNAAKALEQADKLAPGSVEGENAKRMLANIGVLSGKLAAKDKGQKVDVLELQKEARESQRPQEQQQQELVQGALEESRKGNIAAAKKKLEAANALGDWLATDRGLNVGNSFTNSSATKPTLFVSDIPTANFQTQNEIANIQKQSHEQAQQLKADVAKFKQSGDYEKALQAAGKVAQLEDSPQLRKEMEQLAIDASKINVPKDDLGHIRLPTVVTQDIHTTVSVPDGGTLLSGGQKGEADEHEVGVPILSKIPAIDRLSTSRGNARDEETLLILTKPKIVIQKDEEQDRQDAQAMRQVDGTHAAQAKNAPPADLQAANRRAADDNTPIGRLERNVCHTGGSADVAFDAEMRRADQALREADSKDGFENAAAALRAADNVLENNKNYYSADDFRQKKDQVQRQDTLVKERQDAWDRAQVAAKQDEIKMSELHRKKNGGASQRERIPDLIERARVLRSEQMYAEAIEVYKQILKLDPTNTAAADMKAALEQFIVLRQARDSGATQRKEEHKAIKDIGESEIPWYEMLLYPRDWREITARRQPGGAGQGAGEADADRTVRQKLNVKIGKLDFSDTEFSNVIEFLRDISGVNIVVRWQMLAAAGIDKTAGVNVHLTDVRLDKALRVILEDVGGANPLGYVIYDGVVAVSTKSDFEGTVTKTYDIRDLIVNAQNFSGPVIDLSAAININANPSASVFGQGSNAASQPAGSRQAEAHRIVELVQSNLASGTGAITELNGQLVVTQDSKNQEAVERMLTALRAARGPQVEISKTIALQKNVPNLTAPVVTVFNGQRSYVTPNGNGEPVSQGDEKRLKEFIAQNYDWAIKSDKGGQGVDGGWGYEQDRWINNSLTNSLNNSTYNAWTGTVAGVATFDRTRGQLEAKLVYNLGQKVTVNSINANLHAQEAAQLGVKWNGGENGVKWAVVDEAQFRSLMELSSDRDRLDNVAASPSRMQETIVGTDARLANGDSANVAFARESGNTLEILGNSIDLPHQNYIALDNGTSVTLLKAGPMQHWTEAPQEVQFVQVPQSIPVPHVGQLIRLEKSLLEPTDQMVVKVQFFRKAL